MRAASRPAARERIAELSQFMRPGDAPAAFEYRSAGEYILDYWKASVGLAEPKERLELYNRAAAHQTTADNPGLLPDADRAAGHQLHRRRPAADDLARPQADPVATRGSGRR